MEQINEVLFSLGHIYDEIAVVDLKTGNFTTLIGREDRQMIEKIREGNLPDMMELFMETCLEENQKQPLKEFWNLHSLDERMAGRTVISQDFCIRPGIWYCISIIVKSRGEDGHLQSVLITSQNIHERKMKELDYQEKLERALEEAQRANQAKTNFLRRISHDIRTPLNGIIGMIDMGDRNSEDTEKLYEYRRKAYSASEYLLSLVNNILDMGKLEAGEMEPEHQPFDLAELLMKQATVMEMQAKENGIRFQLDKNLPEPQRRYLVGSPVHLSRILMNLVSNAIKYNKMGGHVNLYCRELLYDEEKIVYQFICEDNGYGMSETFQKQAFDLYSQEEKESSTGYSGAGIGLSIVKEMVSQMKGSLQMESKEGEGTRITVTLPFERNRNLSSAEEQPETELRMHGKSALLVEDNELNQEIAKMVLEDLGFHVTMAVNGKEAVDMYRHSQPFRYDYIFMDIMMPVMDGLEAARAIRNSGRADSGTVPILAMTANAFQDDVNNSLEAGMNAHLIKPLERDKIQSAIREIEHRKLLL